MQNMIESKEGEILIVEDNPDDLEITLRALRQANLATSSIVARDGVEALDLIFCEGVCAGRRPETPQMVLLDLHLPRVDGLGVLKRMKSDERTKAIPVIIMTSSKVQTDVTESYHHGANCFLVKPVSFESFTAAVQQLGMDWLLPAPAPQV